MIIVDVGANRGDFSQYILRRSNDIEVYAIEPNAYGFKNHLSKIIDAFPGRFTVGYFALDTKSYAGQLNNIGHNAGQLASLKEINKDSPGWDGFDLSRIPVENSLNVSVHTPQEFMKAHRLFHIDFLKIDIQGNDVEVLEEFLNHHVVKSGVVEVDCGFVEGSQRYLGAANNEINRLAQILAKHRMMICRITPNNSSIDELNVFFATDIEYWRKISAILDLARSPSFSRYWKVQGLGLSTDDNMATLLQNFTKKVFQSIFHPTQSIRSVLLKLSK